MRRVVGSGDLWISEFVITYDGQPSYVVSIMEMQDGKVSRETQYFGDPFEPGLSRAQWVEPICLTQALPDRAEVLRFAQDDRQGNREEIKTRACFPFRKGAGGRFPCA